MKTTLILLVISLLIFSAGCGKKPEEISKTEAMSAQPGELVKSSDKKKKNNIVAENYSDKNNLEPINVVSCAVAFADSLDLNALPKEEDVSALTMEEARNILAQNTNFNNEYITRIITECKDFSVVQYFATTLFYKVCNGETHIEYDFAKMKEEFMNKFPYEKYIDDHIERITSSKNEAAVTILWDLISVLSSQKMYKKTIEIATH